MKRYFGMLLVGVLCLSLIGLGGCRLLDHGSDDVPPPAPSGIAFKIGGTVVLPSAGSSNIRAAVVTLEDNLKAKVYTMAADGTEEQVPGTGEFTVSPNGEYECSFNADKGYFVIKVVSDVNDKFEMIVVLGELDENTNEIAGKQIDSETTAVALVIRKRGEPIDPTTIPVADIQAIKTAVETALTTDGDVAAVDATVTVTEVNVSKATLELSVGAKETLTATLVPAYSTTRSATWESSDTTVATVNAQTGEITALKAGTTNITATADGVSAVCVLTVVVVDATGVSLNKNSLPLTIGAKETLLATVAPSNATNKNVSWSSDNTDVATVDAQTGEVTAVAVGTANITVATEDGGHTAVCAVSVSEAIVNVTSVTVAPTSATIKVGQTEELQATIVPSEASDKGVTWGSSNNNIATVDTNGLVTAVAPGQATITVTTNDGSKTAQSTITVEEVITHVATVMFDTEVTGLFDTDIRIEITDFGDDFTTSAVVKAAGDVDVSLSKSIAESKPEGELVVLLFDGFGIPRELDAFQQITFDPAIPYGSTVKVIRTGQTMETVATSTNTKD